MLEAGQLRPLHILAQAVVMGVVCNSNLERNPTPTPWRSLSLDFRSGVALVPLSMIDKRVAGLNSMRAVTEDRPVGIKSR